MSRRKSALPPTASGSAWKTPNVQHSAHLKRSSTSGKTWDSAIRLKLSCGNWRLPRPLQIDAATRRQGDTAKTKPRSPSPNPHPPFPRFSTLPSPPPCPPPATLKVLFRGRAAWLRPGVGGSFLLQLWSSARVSPEFLTNVG